MLGVMTNIKNCIKTLEKLSLVTCSDEVLPLLERALKNVEPILSVDTRGVEPLLWQSKLDLRRLHDDKPLNTLNTKDIKKNAHSFYEDYVVVGVPPSRS